MKHVIAVKGLKKFYGELAAVNGVDLSVEQGEIFALLGPNGAGKSTTVEILEGFRSRDGGDVQVLDTDPAIGGLSARQWRNRIGIVLQTSNDAGDLTVAESIKHFSHYYSNPRDPEEVIDAVGLREKQGALVRTLSGGQRRRLDVALGIIGNPELLFLDEPTTGLDPRSRGELWDVIRERVDAGTTVILTTQYLEEADQLAHDIVVIDHGRAIARGTSQELKRRIGGEHLDIHLALLSDLSRVEDIVRPFAIGAIRVEDQDALVSIPVAKGVEALGLVMVELTAQNVEILDIGLRRPTLDDVFMELTGKKTKEEES